MVDGVVALQEGYGIIIDDIFKELIGGKCLCDATDIIIWYIVYVGPCGIMGPWVKVPKALEDDTLMWVYGVGPALGYESQKTRGMTCP